MKRIFALLLLLALLPACAAAFDVAPYLLPAYDVSDIVSAPLPLSADAFYWIRSTPVGRPIETYARQLERFDGGQMTFSLLLGEKLDAGYPPFLFSDGRLGVLKHQTRPNEPYKWKHDYTLYDVTGDALTNPRTFPGNPYDLKRLDEGFAGGCDAGVGQSQLVLYDDDANALLHIYFPYEDVYAQAFARSGGVLYLLAQKNAGDGEGLMLLCVKDGALAWANTYATKTNRFNILHAFTDGGALMTGSLREDYKRKRVLCVGADGETRWDKILSASKAVVAPRLTTLQDDGTATLYGYCVAASRDLYTVFAMQLDAGGRALALDVRSTFVDGASYIDTEPTFLLTPQGEVLVHLNLTLRGERSRALVPFEALPEAKDPGITLK